jgi:hypothetical protein
MAELNKAALTSENNNSFPNNNTGFITPDLLRTFNQNMIDSMVDEITYNADSASVSASIAQLKNFSSSLDNTYATDAQLSASVAALSASVAITDLAQSSSIAALQVFSSSLDATFATDAQLSASASTLQNQINLKVDTSQTSSMSVLSSSYAVTASFALNVPATASFAITASYALQALSASYAGNVPETASFAISASQASTASFLLGSIASASFATNAATASFLLGSIATASFALTASEARNVVLIARNGNNSTLGAGTIVHITGASGDNPIFNTASFTSEALSSNTLGMLRTSALSGADVEVLVAGIVTGVNTDPALGYVAGDIIYLSSSGQFTRVQPQAPQQIVTIGQVLRAQQNNGSVYVSINNGWELNELHNVRITTPTEGDLLVYRSGSYGLWENSSSAELGFATTGSNTFKGTQTINLSGSVNTAAIAIIGNDDKVTTDMYVEGGNFDTLNVQVSASNGIQFRDWNNTGGALSTFLEVGTDAGNISIQRTTNITGSLKMTGGSLIASGNLIVSGGGTVAQIIGETSISGNLIVSGNTIISGNFLVTGSNINLEVDPPALGGIGTTNVKAVLDTTASAIVTSLDLTRQAAGPTGDNTGIRLQTFSGSSDTSGDRVLSRITTGVNRHTTLGLSGSVVNTQIVGTWGTGSTAFSSQIVASAQSGSSTLSLNAGNLASNNAGGTASLAAGLIRIGTNDAHRITTTGSFGPVIIVGSGSFPAISVRSGSFELTTPQGSGSFYSNLPITSSGLRINGVALVNDLIISGVFSGNSTLQVTGNASISGNLFVSGTTDISSISASRGVSITGSLPTIQSGSLSGSLIGNLGSVYTASIIPQNVVGIGSASMAFLLSTGGTTPNTLYFVI